LRTELGVARIRTQAVASQRNEVVHGHYRLAGNAEGATLTVITGDEFGKPNKLAGTPLIPELIRVSREIEKLRVGEIDSVWRKLNARFPTT